MFKFLKEADDKYLDSKKELFAFIQKNIHLRKLAFILVFEIIFDILSLLVFLILLIVLLWRGPLFIVLCRKKNIQVEVLQYYMSNQESNPKEAIEKLSYFKIVKIIFKSIL